MKGNADDLNCQRRPCCFSARMIEHALRQLLEVALCKGRAFHRERILEDEVALAVDRESRAFPEVGLLNMLSSIDTLSEQCYD
jgi:hypothetical protein